MGIKSIALAASTLILSTSVNAAIIDNGSYTTDDVSGLDWLDLTVTVFMSYDTVSAQLGAGEQLDGWRYATNTEVVALWANFGVDLSAGSATSTIGSIDTNILSAYILGNTSSLSSSQLNGTTGITGTVAPSSNYYRMGAYNRYNDAEFWLTENTYFNDGATDDMSPTTAFQGVGSYLVRTSVVPVPAAVWLFGSGLIGLIGVARRKNV